jgi:Xaa-Pro dipeptidase
MHRRAATPSDDALDAAPATTRAGAFKSDILADMQGAVFRGGGDYEDNDFIISKIKELFCAIMPLAVYISKSKIR